MGDWLGGDRRAARSSLLRARLEGAPSGASSFAPGRGRYDRLPQSLEAPTMSRPKLTVRLNPADNVVVARLDVLEATPLASEDVVTAERIPAGHKVATRPIAKGEPI